MSRQKPDLGAAYSLRTPEDSKRLYKDWAETYDESFARKSDYLYPEAIARLTSKLAQPEDEPVLDVGAGTGLVAEALSQLRSWRIDGLDISPEMLGQAMAKGCYRSVIVGDLTGRLDIDDGQYGLVASAGTFTHGHVGAEAVDELMRVARPGALFVLGINAQVYRTSGFEAKFSALGAAISGFRVQSVRIYGENADASHANDLADVAVFRKA